MSERVEQLTLAERIKRICDSIEAMPWECNVPAEEREATISEMRLLRALLHEVKVPAEQKKPAQVVRTPILADADMVQRVRATLTVNYPAWSLHGYTVTTDWDNGVPRHKVVGIKLFDQFMNVVHECTQEEVARYNESGTLPIPDQEVRA